MEFNIIEWKTLYSTTEEFEVEGTGKSFEVKS